MANVVVQLLQLYDVINMTYSWIKIVKPYYLLFNTLLYILLITNSKALCHQQDIQNRNKHFLFRFDLVLWGYTYQNQNNNLIHYSKTTLIEVIK